MLKHLLGSALALSWLAMAGPASAEGQNINTSALDTCIAAVSALGASMGHEEVAGPDGRVLYKFRLRTSGYDYNATCDAQTGMVSDVTPHLVSPAGSAS